MKQSSNPVRAGWGVNPAVHAQNSSINVVAPYFSQKTKSRSPAHFSVSVLTLSEARLVGGPTPQGPGARGPEPNCFSRTIGSRAPNRKWFV